MIQLTGSTFPVRAKLKKLGCTWTGSVWMAPDEVAVRAQALVEKRAALTAKKRGGGR
jgi:hypothetical protein